MNTLEQDLVDVGLEIGALTFVGRVKGRTHTITPLLVEFERELDYQDLVERASTEVGSKPPVLKTLRDSHHNIARMMAEGLRNEAISAVSGYAASRISILKKDPAFEELVEFYRDSKEKHFTDVNMRLSQMALDAVAEIQVRLDEEPEKVKMGELMELSKLGMDRTGHGPTQTLKTENLNYTPEDLRKMKERVRGQEKVTVLEGKIAEKDSRITSRRVSKSLSSQGPEIKRLPSPRKKVRECSGEKATPAKSSGNSG